MCTQLNDKYKQRLFVNSQLSHFPVPHENVRRTTPLSDTRQRKDCLCNGVKQTSRIKVWIRVRISGFNQSYGVRLLLATTLEFRRCEPPVYFMGSLTYLFSLLGLSFSLLLPSGPPKGQNQTHRPVYLYYLR